jgi:RHS repeat-associated protein
MTDEAGGVVWRGVYDPFGKAAIDGGSSVEMNVRFPGQYHDQETGLHYNYFRYYDPSVGRYITSDPIGLDGGINPYLYAEASPIIFVDPFGLVHRCANGDFNCAAGILPNPDYPKNVDWKCFLKCMAEGIIPGYVVQKGGEISAKKASKSRNRTLAKIGKNGVKFIPIAGNLTTAVTIFPLLEKCTLECPEDQCGIK